MYEPKNYWETRHRNHDFFRSGGDIGLSENSNVPFYYTRLGTILNILTAEGIHSYSKILDAGCGKGWFALQYAKLGYSVAALDLSPAAIELAPKHPNVKFQVTDIAKSKIAPCFDAAIAVDVLFHITEDIVWKNAVKNLANSLKIGGLLVFSDHCTEDTFLMGNYICHRSIKNYNELLRPIGLKLQQTHPFNFPGNHNSFYVFKKGINGA